MRHTKFGKMPLTITGKHTTPDILSLFLRGMLVAGMVAVAGCGGGGGGGGAAATDTTAPTAQSMAITSATGMQNSTLNTGDVCSITLTMIEATTVTLTPQLALNIGGTTVQADYASGSGTTELVFQYTIQAGQNDANGISIDANSLTLNSGTLKDAAGNDAVLTHGSIADNISYLVDTTAPPSATLTAASIANNGNATVQGGETGTAYLVKNTLAVSTLAEITGAADNQWNSVAIATANSDTSLSVTGLAAGVYKLYTDDAAGNLTAVASATAVVTNTTFADRIDLGAGGNLIAPVYVEGNWYFYWDRDGDLANTGVDNTTHDVLDGILTQDINGVANTTVQNADLNYGTTDTYRYATLNGVKVALPTANGGIAYPNGIDAFQSGTAIGNATPTLGDSSENATYDGLLAIWDGYNGTGTGTIINGTPTGWGWQSYGYWSATPSTYGHANVNLNIGGVYDYGDTNSNYVALQVL